LAGISRKIERETVVLPQPDSPTSPKVSPSLDGEAHIIHRLDPGRNALEDARAHREIGLEVLDNQDVFLCLH
jgi:hypothetical protein